MDANKHTAKVALLLTLLIAYYLRAQEPDPSPPEPAASESAATEGPLLIDCCPSAIDWTKIPPARPNPRNGWFLSHPLVPATTPWRTSSTTATAKSRQSCPTAPSASSSRRCST